MVKRLHKSTRKVSGDTYYLRWIKQWIGSERSILPYALQWRRGYPGGLETHRTSSQYDVTVRQRPMSALLSLILQRKLRTRMRRTQLLEYSRKAMLFKESCRLCIRWIDIRGAMARSGLMPRPPGGIEKLAPSPSSSYDATQTSSNNTLLLTGMT